MMKEPLITINISRNQTLLFYETHLVYRGENINYADIDGVSYLWTKTTTRVYFVPISTNNKYAIKIQSKGKIHNIQFSSGSFSSYKSDKEKEEIFKKFYAVIENLIKPCVVINLLLRFAKEKEFELDSITITPAGLYRKRLFRAPDFMPWSQYYNTVLSRGTVSVLKSDPKKKYRSFYYGSMAIMNAAALPEFLNILFQKEGNLDQATIKELEERRHTFLSSVDRGQDEWPEKGEFCWSCAAPIEKDQRFCTHCGSKLL